MLDKCVLVELTDAVLRTKRAVVNSAEWIGHAVLHGKHDDALEAMSKLDQLVVLLGDLVATVRDVEVMRRKMEELLPKDDEEEV